MKPLEHTRVIENLEIYPFKIKKRGRYDFDKFALLNKEEPRENNE